MMDSSDLSNAEHGASSIVIPTAQSISDQQQAPATSQNMSQQTPPPNYREVFHDNKPMSTNYDSLGKENPSYTGELLPQGDNQIMQQHQQQYQQQHQQQHSLYDGRVQPVQFSPQQHQQQYQQQHSLYDGRVQPVQFSPQQPQYQPTQAGVLNVTSIPQYSQSITSEKELQKQTAQTTTEQSIDLLNMLPKSKVNGENFKILISLGEIMKISILL